MTSALRPTPLDASRIAPYLFQGSRPPPGAILARAGFTALVLCALEFQPQPAGDVFPGLRVIHAPMVDEVPIASSTIFVARRAALLAAEQLRAGGRVLVTCQAGLNRSGLVTALTLREVNGLSGRRNRQIVQACRKDALSNAAFAAYLDTLDARK